jgi:glucose/arabinose dehydrogenase
MTRLLALAAIPFLCTACSAATPTAATSGGGLPFKVEPVATLDSPWAMAFLPDGRMLVTEKKGTLILLARDGKSSTPLAGIPAVDSDDQGALMDIVLAPDFASSRRVYFSYSAKGPGGSGVVLARGIFVDGARPALDKVETLFTGSPFVVSGGHYSGRIAFSPDGQYLFFTNGERQKFTPAQDPKATLGKVLRLTLDGKPAPGNPLAAKGFNPAIWSYGHRNLLGIAFDTGGRLWEIEMGPKGGDEVNLIRPGLNYGWPRASNGDNYDGTPIPDHKPGDGYEPPKLWWNPSISPASLMIYSGDLFPQWKGSAFIPALSGEALIRVSLDGDKAAKADQWDMKARIRDAVQGPDGAIWLLEDGPGGRLMKLTPAA